MRGVDDVLKRRLRGDFVPIPIKARVAYLPRVTEDRRKKERFAVYVQDGVFFGYAQDLVSGRAYWVCDEVDLFQKGVFRVAAAENMRLLAVAGSDGHNQLVYPFLVASHAAKTRAINAIKKTMPKPRDGGTKRARGSSAAGDS